MRIAACIEYDGRGYRGWQRQREAPSIQGVVEAALSRVADHPVATVCAGRTDSGVHATGQVISFDTRALRSPRSWLLGANSNLPRDVSLVWIQPVDTGFHARFSAIARRYRYIICNRPSRPALLADQVGWHHRPLDERRMRGAARALLGEHDFSAFRSSGCQAHHPVRVIQQLSVNRHGEFVEIDVQANGFLHNMVRIIAGVLMCIGRGDAEPAWVEELLRSGDRRRSGVTAPAGGLYFVGPRYPPDVRLPPIDRWPRLAHVSP